MPWLGDMWRMIPLAFHHSESLLEDWAWREIDYPIDTHHLLYFCFCESNCAGNAANAAKGNRDFNNVCIGAPVMIKTSEKLIKAATIDGNVLRLDL